MRYKIVVTDEFLAWLEDLTAKDRVQVAKRLENIKEEGHFGDNRQVRNDIWELRWKNGRRVYFSFITMSQVLLLTGGNKNGQTKDINQAEKIYKEWVYD